MCLPAALTHNLLHAHLQHASKCVYVCATAIATCSILLNRSDTFCFCFVSLCALPLLRVVNVDNCCCCCCYVYFFAYYCRLAAPKSAATASPVFAIINCTATTCVASDVVDVAATRVIAPSKQLLSTCTRRIAMALLINMLTHTHTHTRISDDCCTAIMWQLVGVFVAAFVVATADELAMHTVIVVLLIFQIFLLCYADFQFIIQITRTDRWVHATNRHTHSHL